MKTRFRLIHRGERSNQFYCVDSETGKRFSLKTKDRDAAAQIVLAKNQSLRQPSLNLQIAKAYLAGTDNGIATRTWQNAIESLTNTKQGANKDRWQRVVKDAALVPLLPQVIIETKAEALLKALHAGTVSTNVFLRRLHNFCVDMNWLPWPLIPKRQWPAVHYKEKRAIMLDEHRRIPYHGEVMIRRDNFFVYLSSNGVDTTRDFANRSSIIRIRKKPEGYSYLKYKEGDLLAHVRANQTWYLGCVFAVVRAWYKAECPRTDETRHDFREWVQTLDWIVQKLFGGARIMDGHRQAQDNVSSPAMVFLRSVAIAAEQGNRLGDLLTTTEIFRLCEESSIDVPQLREGAEESQAVKRIGCVLSRVFGKGETIEVDSYQVRRDEQQLKREDGEGYFTQKRYCIERSSPPPTDPQATAATAATAVAG